MKKAVNAVAISSENYVKFQQSFSEAGPIYLDAVPLPNISYYIAEDMDYLVSVTRGLMDCIYALSPMIISEYEELTTLLGYDSQAKDMMRSKDIVRDLKLAKLFARTDYIYEDHHFMFLETNVSAPLGGMGIADRYYTIMEEMSQQTSMKNLQGYKPYINWAKGIEDAHRTYTNKKSPYIVVACWDEEVSPESSDASEGVFFLREYGLHVDIAPFTQLAFKSDGIYYNGQVVDVIYGTTLLGELLASPRKRDLYMKIKDYHEAGQVLYLVPMLSNIMGNKGVYALLSDENYAHLFPSVALSQIQPHLPWTRFLKDSSLVELVTENKDEFVLKPTNSFSGQGIYIGKNMDQETWKKRITQCLNDHYIVQKYIQTDRQPVQIFDGSKMETTYFRHCYGALWFNDCFSGLFIRSMPSTGEDIINISKGSLFTVGFMKGEHND